MRYFDALTDAHFKTDKDGRTVFFPWGMLGHGYALASPEEAQKLRRQIKSYVIVSVVLIVVVLLPLGWLAGLAVGTPLILFYLVWMFSLLRRLQRSDVRMSVTEGLQAQASGYNPIVLWLMDFFSVACVAVGVIILIVEPGEWPMALLTVVMFGTCAAVFTRMLVLRRRTTAQ